MDIQKYKKFIIAGAVLLLLLIIFGSSMFYIVKPGERAITFRPFGSGLDTTRISQPGFHIVAPWNDFIVYNVKERKTEETMEVLDKNGLSINVEISVRFNPIPKKLPFLHQQFGEDYMNQLIVPEVRSTVRQVMGRYTAEEIYSTKRAEVEGEIIIETTQKLQDNSVETRAVLIRSINLPPQIKNAIETKLQQEQESLAYQFRIEKETKEAERKRIEAEGEATANKIINSSLTQALLTMRGIETTLKLATSPNSKIVVIGGSDGMPLILNQ
ncbi:MAG: prohibitin family protein [Bacteroidales bacterium]|nr:prohibitin family protein [Bacteroidales bacterium]MDD4216832.1 prohibitin family protein [Bacteroidales bacterium]MDY0142976.1 prohibitin family protein [Bacteroidales bacterium]